MPNGSESGFDLLRLVPLAKDMQFLGERFNQSPLYQRIVQLVRSPDTWAGMFSPGASMGGVRTRGFGRLGESGISPEAVSRPGVHFKVGRGTMTYLGKDVDANLRPGEAVVTQLPDGTARVVNSNGLSDSDVLTLFARVKKNLESK